MRGVTHHDHEKLTLLELVLQLHGEFRRSLEPMIHVRPLQAGVLLFLRRHAEANVTHAAAAIRVKLPTVSEVVKGLVRKRWVIKRRSVTDTRVVHLRLSRQGLVITRKIENQVQRVRTGVTANKDLTAAGLTQLHRVPVQHKEASS